MPNNHDFTPNGVIGSLVHEATVEKCAAVADRHTEYLRLPGQLKAEAQAYSDCATIIAKDIRSLKTGATGAGECALPDLPDDPWSAFAHLVGRCGEGFGRELLAQGKTETQARNIIIGCFLDFASGEACRIARREDRQPDHEKWRKATDDAFERAVKRTAPPPPSSNEAA